MPSDLSSGERAREVLARYVDRRTAGERVSLEELCCEHPSLAEELRELVPLAESLLERLSPSLGGSFSERLRQRFGGGVDPQVELEAEGEVRSDSKASPGTTESSTSSEVLARLAGRGQASTRYRVKDEITVTDPALYAGPQRRTAYFQRMADTATLEYACSAEHWLEALEKNRVSN